MPTIEAVQAISKRLACESARVIETAFDEMRYQAISNRLADELARGATLLRIAIETNIDNEQLAAWTKTPEEFLYHPPRYTDQVSTGENIEAKLTAWLDEQEAERAAKPFTPGYVDITVSRNVIEGLEMARATCKPVEISSAPGTGKTSGVVEYLTKCRKAEGFACPVWMITLHETNISLKIIYQEILSQLKTKKSWERVSGESSEYALQCEIEDSAARLKRGGLLIIDEAQHIGKFNGNIRPNGRNILNGLRCLTDQKLFGIAFLCNGEVFEQANTAKARTIQHTSRMKAWRVDAKKNTADDIDQIMAAWKVSGKDERILSHNIGLSEGGLRALTEIYERALFKFGVINANTISFYM